MTRTTCSLVLVALALALSVGCSDVVLSLDPSGFPTDAGRPPPEDSMLKLGQALFFDPELSGNRNISCGTCHVPFLTTAEGLPLSMGEGAREIGPFRARGDGAIIARHTLDLFHRSDMDVLFWDGRVERLASGELIGPVAPPPGLETALELASILPLLDRAEMLGQPGDIAADGRLNELASIEDEHAVWNTLAARLRAIGRYVTMFERAFGDSTISIARVAQALAHFQATLWGTVQSVLELGGASEAAQRGEVLFRGAAGCARCHGGLHFTDQRFHNLAIPQLGPGLDGSGLDEGRFDVTSAPADRFAFRTPPLRNVALTPPYMHNGAYATLEAAIRHHLDPVGSLHAYSGEGHLPTTLRATLRTEPALLEALTANVADTAPLRPLDDAEIADLIAFLEALANPDELSRHFEDALPGSVPSGLPIDRWNGTEHPFR